jgi:tetratricopeptide (TPR) repeat protein
MKDFDKALSFYEKALEIGQRKLPPNDSNLIAIYNNIGIVYELMEDHSKATSFFQRNP